MDAWKKFWWLLWKDDSWKGWIFSIVFLFLFIKFIFFPLLSLFTGTTLPLAIVESCSMYHKDNFLSDFNEWYSRHEEKYDEFDVSEENFENFPFKKGLNKGDILFVIGVKPEKIKIGDVVIFEAGRKNPLIHRVIEIKKEPETEQYAFSTIGDNNNGQLSIEKDIQEEQLIGRPVARVGPYLGWLKLLFFEPFRDASQRGFCREN